MDIVIWGMLAALLMMGWSAWSCGRSYYNKGRLAGAQQIVAQLERGVSPQLSQSGKEEVREAVRKLEGLLTNLGERRPLNKAFGEVWRVGHTVADVCWREGHAAGLRRRAPAEGMLRLDLPLLELLHLGRLANVGFQTLMPNSRHEFRRFSDENDAREAVHAITRLEAAIPKQHRPDIIAQAEVREKLIKDWWEPINHRWSA